MASALMDQMWLIGIVLCLSVSAAVGHQLTPHSTHNAYDKNADGIGDLNCPNDTNLCQDGFTLFPSMNCYLFSCVTATWDGALDVCRRLNATLAYPQNINEDSTLSNYLRLKYKGTYNAWWLGGSDRATQGKWVWAHDNSPIIYTNWAPNEPTNGPGEDCLCCLEADAGKWHDFGCSTLLPFICQQL